MKGSLADECEFDRRAISSMNFETPTSRLKSAADERSCVLMSIEGRPLQPSVSTKATATVHLEVATWAHKASTTSGPIYTIPPKRSASHARLTAQGRSLLLLNQSLSALGVQAPQDVEFHPAVRICMDAYRAHLADLYEFHVPTSFEWISPSTAAAMQGFLHQVRQAFQQPASRGWIRRHKDQRAMTHRILGKYLNDLAKKHTDAHVLRFELGGHDDGAPQTSDAYARSYEKTRDLGLAWLQLAIEQLGGALVGDVLKVDRGVKSRYDLHALLVIDGPLREELPVIRDALAANWKELNGEHGYALDCDLITGFRYRGASGDHFFETPLRERLKDAALFLAATDLYWQVCIPGRPSALAFAHTKAKKSQS
jgi:hypothetical protein